MSDSDMSSSLRTKLLWLIAGRAAAITLVLGSAILIQIKSPGSLPIDPFFILIAVTYGLTVVYSLLLNQSERYRWLVDLQLGCDAVIVSAIVYLTGGVASYFSPLYALPIIAASTIESRRGGVMVGVLSAILYSGLVLVQYLRPRGVADFVTIRRCCRRSAWRGSRSASTCSGSSPSPRSAATWRKVCVAPTNNWRSRRTRSPTCRRSASTSSTA